MSNPVGPAGQPTSFSARLPSASVYGWLAELKLARNRNRPATLGAAVTTAVWPLLTAIGSADAATVLGLGFCTPFAGRANMNHTGPACTLCRFQSELSVPPFAFWQSLSAVLGPA